MALPQEGALPLSVRVAGNTGSSVPDRPDRPGPATGMDTPKALRTCSSKRFSD